MNTKEAAIFYASEYHWPVFPCRANKTPYTENGVLDATTNIKKIKEWWKKWPRANVALNCGDANLVVIDLDPGYDPNQLEDNIGPLPKTKLKATTPRGGTHLFYALDQGEVIPLSQSKLARKVDIRSFHSYVLLAPSRTADGDYEWLDEGRPAFRPQELVDFVAKDTRSRSEDHDNWIIEPDLEENIDKCIQWLRKDAQIAIEGVNGDITAYKTAAMCKSYGISPETAMDLMWEYWNPRCDPPWSEEEVDHFENKIENGYRYNTSPPGNVTNAYKVAKAQELFKPVKRQTEHNGTEIKSGRFRIVNRAAINEIREPSWLVKDTLPEGSYSLLIGPRGTFKTFIALDLALSLATGANTYFEDGEWSGCWPEVAGPVPVLFAAGEGRGGIKKRIRAWEKRHLDGNEAENLHLIDPVPHPTPEDVTTFIELALQMRDSFSLVVLDTVGRAMQGRNENQQQDASAFTQMAETIQRELKCAVLGLHHTGHGDVSRARGSSVFGADVDAEFVLERHQNFIKIMNTKQKDAPEWSEYRVVQLAEVGNTLVPVRPVNGQMEEFRKLAYKETKQRKAQPASYRSVDMKVVRDVAYQVLADAPGKEFTKIQFSEALASHDQISVSAQAIRRRYMGELVTDKNHAISKCYDPLKSRWRLKRKKEKG